VEVRAFHRTVRFNYLSRGFAQKVEGGSARGLRGARVGVRRRISVHLSAVLPTNQVMGKCVDYAVLLPSILVPIAVISLAVCLGALSRKSAQMVKQAKTAAANERDLNEFIAYVDVVFGKPKNYKN